MEVHNISLESRESDTSGDEMEDEEELKQLKTEYLMDEGNPFAGECEKWRRPRPPPVLSLAGGKFAFYLLSCESTASIERNPLSCYYENASLNFRDIKPVMRLFGTDESGGTVLCTAHGFTQYFYAVPSNDFGYDDIPAFLDCLNQAVLHEMNRDLESANLLKHFDEDNPPVVEVELLHDSSELNIFGYHRSRTDRCEAVILKIHCWLSSIVWLAAKVLKNGVVTYPFVDDPCSYNVYEDTLNPTVRFLSSLNIACCSWIELDLIPGKWNDRDVKLDPVLERLSYLQTELDVHYVCIKAPETSKLKLNIPKLWVLSFDIECMTRPPDYKFPRNGNDRVLQIGNVLEVFDQQSSNQRLPLRVVFTLDTCDPIDGAHVFSFKTEDALLDAWRKFVITTDPDILTGYNISKFDIPFLLDRARVIKADKLPFFGRIVKSPASFRKILHETKRISKFADTISSVPGRIVFDMLPVIRQMFPNLQSFKLGEVSQQLLKDEYKDDVHFRDIFILQNRSPSSRQKLARYCLQDAWLVSKLIFRNPSDSEDQECSQSILSHFFEMSRCSGSPLRYLVSKSREYQKYFKTVRKQKNPGVVFPPSTPYASAKKRQAEHHQNRFDKVRRSLFKSESSQKSESMLE